MEGKSIFADSNKFDSGLGRPLGEIEGKFEGEDMEALVADIWRASWLFEDLDGGENRLI